jgi:hypothetical protein
MTLAELIMENSLWFWPCYYTGLGFALSAVLISTVYFAHSLRRAVEKGAILNAVAELCIVALFFPGMLAILAIATAIGITREKAMPGSFWFFSVALVFFTGLAWYIFSRLNASLVTKEQ